MRDYIEIGPVPCNEECQQVGTANYNHEAAREECRRFIALIRKTLGTEPHGAELRIKSNSHDFGTYLEVVCYYDDNIEASEEYAYKVESDAPQNWDNVVDSEVDTVIAA